VLYPNCWDQPAAGHVDEGYSYDQAAVMELAEEIGLENVALTTLGTHRFNTKTEDRIINQFARVYSVKVPHDVALRPDAKEVGKLQWFTPSELCTHIKEHPEEFVPGLLYDLRKYYPAILAE